MRGKGLSPPEFPARLLLSTLNFCTFSIFLSNPTTLKKRASALQKQVPFTNFTYDYFPHIIVITIGQLIKCFPCQVLGKCLVGINWHNTHPKFQTEVLRSPVGGRVRLCQSLLYQPTSKQSPVLASVKQGQRKEKHDVNISIGLVHVYVGIRNFTAKPRFQDVDCLFGHYI